MRIGWVITALFLVWAAAAKAQAEPPVVNVKTVAGARVTEIEIPGYVLGVTAAGDGDRLAILTTADSETERTVHLLDPRDEAGLTTTVEGLSAASHALASLPSGEVLVGEKGRIYSLGPDATTPPRLRLESPHVDLFFLHHRGLLLPNGVFQPQVGRLLAFATDAEGPWPIRDQIELPREVRRERRGLRLETPPTTVLDRADGSPLVLVGPVARGNTRLLTTWIDASTRNCDDEDCEQRRQRWAKLPGPEFVTESFYVDVDGRATLIVASAAADKVGVFECKRLRVFPLWSDRTRAGVAPSLRAETTSRRWQRIRVEILDLDGDDHDDLVVLQRDGFSGKKTVVEAFAGTGNGGFYNASRKTELSTGEAGWRYGHDLNGDDRPDLVTLAEGRLLVFAGVDHKRRVIGKKPAWTFEPPEASGGLNFDMIDADSASKLDPARPVGGLEIVDLGRDGRHEIVVWSASGGRTWLRLIEL